MPAVRAAGLLLRPQHLLRLVHWLDQALICLCPQLSHLLWCSRLLGRRQDQGSGFRVWDLGSVLVVWDLGLYDSRLEVERHEGTLQNRNAV